MNGRWSDLGWAAGWPVRVLLLSAVRAYRLTIGQVVGGGCRFSPSCSAYAEAAIANAGAIRGTGLAVWRILRCSPLTLGGMDPPPLPRRGRATANDIVIPSGGGGGGMRWLRSR